MCLVVTLILFSLFSVAHHLFLLGANIVISVYPLSSFVAMFAYSVGSSYCPHFLFVLVVFTYVIILPFNDTMYIY